MKRDKYQTGRDVILKSQQSIRFPSNKIKKRYNPWDGIHTVIPEATKIVKASPNEKVGWI